MKVVSEKIAYWLMAGFFVTLYMGPVLNNLFIGALVVYSFFLCPLSERIQAFKERKALLLIAAFYLWNVISALMSQNLAEGLSMIQLRSPLLLLPLAIGTLRMREVFRNKVLLSYAVATTLASLACLVSAIIHYVHFRDAGYLYNDSLSDLTGIQSVYFALMVEIALFALGYLLINGALRPRLWVWLCILFLLVIQFMLASRTGIILLYSVTLCFAGWYYFIHTKRWQQGLGLMGVILVGALVFTFFFPKTLNRFHELAYTDYHYNSHAVESHYNMQLTPDQWNGANIRLAIWKCGWAVAKEHPWSGVPLGDKRDVLVRQYEAVHFDFAAASRRNTHSTYLDVLITFGFPGLVLFVLGFLILPLYDCLRKGDWLGVIVNFAFLVGMVTETLIDRSLGCVLMGFFLGFFLAGTTTKETVGAGASGQSPRAGEHPVVS